MKHQAGRDRERLRRRVFNESGGVCLYCGHLLSPYRFTLDHIHPRQRGGHREKRANLAACCSICNSFKGGDLLPFDARFDRTILLAASVGIRHRLVESRWLPSIRGRVPDRGVLRRRKQILRWVSDDAKWGFRMAKCDESRRAKKANASASVPAWFWE